MSILAQEVVGRAQVLDVVAGENTVQRIEQTGADHARRQLRRGHQDVAVEFARL